MGLKTIRLPEVFVFKDDSLDVAVRVLSCLSKSKYKRILVDFSRVRRTRKGDLMVLLAQLEKLVLKGKSIGIKEGNIPRVVSKIFSKKVSHFTEKTIEKYVNASKSRMVDPQIVASISHEIKKLGIGRDTMHGLFFYDRVESLLTEIIGNAIEHGIKEKQINCWLTSEMNDKQITVTFVDMGQGIALSHKKANVLPWRHKVIGLFSDHGIVLDSLFGKLPSSTQEMNRGKGLPEIRSIIEKGFVSDFILITNRTSIQYINKQFVPNRVRNFKGTYYSWTINKQNYEKWESMQ